MGGYFWLTSEQTGEGVILPHLFLLLEMGLYFENCIPIELKAAQVKCRTCGMHSDNGANSQCDECTYNELHGLN